MSGVGIWRRCAAWWGGLRLHVQLAVLGSLVIAVTLAADGYWTALRQVEQARQRMVTDATILARWVAVPGAQQIVRDDLAALEELLLDYADFPGVALLRVVDLEGRPLGTVRRAADGRIEAVYGLPPTPIPEAARTRGEVVVLPGDRADHLDVWQPVRTSTLLGWLNVEYSLAELAGIRHAIWRDNLRTSLAAIVIDFLILLLILRPPMRALRRATRFARELRGLRGDSLATRPSSREVNELTEALNQASRALSEQHHTIRGHADRLAATAGELAEAKAVLEQRVEERTRELSWQATHDPLTQLHNRGEFERRLKELVRQAAQDGSEHALLYLDLDQFKVVNDTCGHFAGDELLRQVSLRLSRGVRGADVLARLGGDEFGVLLENCSVEKGREVAEKLLESIREYRFAWQDSVFSIGASIGLVAITRQARDAAALMSAADIACYAAKDGGRNAIRVYAAEDAEQARREGEMRWTARITKAIRDEMLHLACQPIFPLRPGLDEPAHYEILLRMHDARGRQIPPSAFLPAAERYGLIHDLDSWVLDSALQHYAEHHGCADAARPVYAVNISGPSLASDRFLAYAVDKLREYAVPAGALCVEITETAAITNLTRALRFMESLKALGCRFALDDFGTGLASFSYLKSLPVDYLKIDGGFVQDILDDTLDRTIVESINNLSHAMGLKTIAECVESEAVLARLRALGVDYAQGYHLARPMPLSELVHVPGFGRHALGRQA